MKKALSVLLAIIICLSCCMMAMAKESPALKFDSNGEFKILHLCDCQDTYPAKPAMMQYINYMLDTYEPDLVVLGGDNTIGPEGTKEQAIEELLKPFVEHKTYFTLVFGNHDREMGYTNDELLPFYQKYGKGYCLAYDAVPSLSGSANHVLPILGKDNKVAYNLYMLDSGTSGYVDEAGHSGYEGVYPDQIEWFEKTNEAATKLNGNKYIPSMVFQHIIVGAVMDALYMEKKDFPLSVFSEYSNGKEYDVAVAKLSAIEKGGMYFEVPSPGVEDFGEFDAMVRQGVVATFAGHDHVNSFTIKHKGVDIVNTPGATVHAYGNDLVRGSRLITLYEGKTEYGSEVITYSEEILKGADIDYSGFKSFFGVVFNRLIGGFISLFNLF